MNFNIFNSIILTGILQGLIFGIVVLASKKNRARSTLFLTALIVAFSLNNLQYYLQDSGIITSKQLFDYLFIPYQYIAGPLLLFYGMTLMYPDKKFSSGIKLTFVPFIAGFVLAALYKILVAVNYLNETAHYYFSFFPIFTEFFSIVFDQAIVAYLLWEVNKLHKQKNAHSVGLSARIRWFKIILVSFLLLSFVWLYIAILSFIHNVETAYYIIWIAMSIMIYWLGHIGIYNYGITEERKKIKSFSIENKSAYTAAKRRSEHISALKNLLVENKRFLEPTLTLDMIAKELNLSKTHLSRTINAELGMGFPDYLNSLRVEEAKSYLRNPQFAHYTLVAIGLEAGFNSKTTFNTAFKKNTSITPSEYRNST